MSRRQKIRRSVRLLSVSMSSPESGWILGSVSDPGEYLGDSATSLVVLHFQNGRWTRENIPILDSITSGTVYAVSSREAWIVGDTSSPGSGSQNALFHEVDGQWVQAALPASLTTLPRDTLALGALAVVGLNDIWLAVNNSDGKASAELVHDVNGVWTTVLLQPNVQIAHIVMLSPQDGWAVGGIARLYDAVGTPLALHYDGKSWKPYTLPQPASKSQYPGGGLEDISMLSSREGWIVGTTILNSPEFHAALFYHDVAGQWQPMITPLPANLWSVDRIVMLSSSNGWGIGTRVFTYPQSGGVGYAYPSVIVHYDGQKWQVVLS